MRCIERLVGVDHEKQRGPADVPPRVQLRLLVSHFPTLSFPIAPPPWMRLKNVDSVCLINGCILLLLLLLLMQKLVRPILSY